jgi:hypothetical protein
MSHPSSSKLFSNMWSIETNLCPRNSLLNVDSFTIIEDSEDLLVTIQQAELLSANVKHRLEMMNI